MTPIKSDLICEIIRKSQTNLLEKKGETHCCSMEDHDQLVLKWVKDNAKNYREYYRDQLGDYTTSQLGEILKSLDESSKDLNEVLEDSPSFVEKN